MNHVIFDGSLAQVVTAALPEFPNEYRLFEIHEKLIHADMKGLSDVSFASRSLVDGYAWTAGSDNDRSFDLPLA